MDEELPLDGGNVSADVVRIGDTVRKPWTAATPHVHSFIAAVRRAGVDVPTVSGPDQQGRQMIEFIPGTLAIESSPLTRAELTRVGAMVRAIHDASASFVPDSDARWTVAIPASADELICHNDLAPWNLIIGDRWAFIDWDAAGPSTRVWDLAYSAQAFTLSDVDRPPEESALDLAAFVDGYRADPPLRAALPDAMRERTVAMYELLRSSHVAGRDPWGSMFVDGHGDHWRAATGYVEEHRALWAQALG